VDKLKLSDHYAFIVFSQSHLVVTQCTLTYPYLLILIPKHPIYILRLEHPHYGNDCQFLESLFS